MICIVFFESNPSNGELFMQLIYSGIVKSGDCVIRRSRDGFNTPQLAAVLTSGV